MDKLKRGRKDSDQDTVVLRTKPKKKYRPNNVIYLTWKKNDGMDDYKRCEKYITNNDSYVTFSKGGKFAFVTTYYRVLEQNGWLDDLSWESDRSGHIIMENADKISIDEMSFQSTKDDKKFKVKSLNNETFHFVSTIYDGETRLHCLKTWDRYNQKWVYEIWGDEALDWCLNKSQNDDGLLTKDDAEILTNFGFNYIAEKLDYTQALNYLEMHYGICFKPCKQMLENGDVFWVCRVTITGQDADGVSLENGLSGEDKKVRYTNQIRQSIDAAISDGLKLAWRITKKNIEK